MNRFVLLALVSMPAAVQWTQVFAQTSIQILTAGCADDAKKFCANVPSGEGRIIACLKQNKDSLSDQCKQAAAQATRMSSGSSQGATAPATPPTGATSAAPSESPAMSPAAPVAHARATTPAGSGMTAHAKPTGYLVMKKVQITAPGPDAAHPTMPAYDLMIPPDWKMQGTIQLGGSPSGCFSDLFAFRLRVASADGTEVFAGGPDYSTQYADDPSVLKSLNDPQRRALGVGGKPCPVAQPMKAEEYIRQNIVKLYPSGTTVVSAAPFPELNEIVRKRQGLPPGNSSTGSTRTDAVRVRLAWQQDGKDVEAWVAVATVVNIIPAGRGSLYDFHATSLVALSAPKGKLEADDKLFQIMIGSIQPEPQWVTYSGGMLSKLYTAQAQKVATMNKLWSDFYAHEAQVVNGVTANSIKGSNASVFHEDQNIRGVQTFRDPATGETQELSNLYDNAWKRDGSDEYVMSNDSSLNPNTELSGNWSQLQAVN